MSVFDSSFVWIARFFDNKDLGRIRGTSKDLVILSQPNVLHCWIGTHAWMPVIYSWLPTHLEEHTARIRAFKISERAILAEDLRRTRRRQH